MSEQLKPCPFCGGKAVKCDYQHENGGDYYFIKCDECESRSDEWGSITQAIQNWNTRLIEEALRTENEVLKARVAKIEEYHNGAIHALNRRGENHIGKLQAENQRMREAIDDVLLGFPYLNVDTFLTINRQMEQRLRKALQGGE